MTLVVVAMMAVVFAAAAVQRVAGVGFALIAAPVLVLLRGPDGIVLANLLGAAVCAVVLMSVWRDVDGRRALLLAPAGLLGVLPGVYLSTHLSPGPLQVTIGLIILIGLAGALVSRRLRLSPTTGTTLASGLGSGFMTASAGVGGPTLTFYAITTRWEQRSFAATVQISFLGQATLALALKGFAPLPGPLPTLALLAAMGAGTWTGRAVAGRVPAQGARTAAVVVALAGAAATTVKGLLTWVA
ncbi:MAG TPA: TSUP family transporter [Candidatus Limnocylindrales bacterium]|nr:TSUP family transporter [Candidatus Limnocylindrales bacterium]